MRKLTARLPVPEIHASDSVVFGAFSSATLTCTVDDPPRAAAVETKGGVELG